MQTLIEINCRTQLKIWQARKYLTDVNWQACVLAINHDHWSRVLNKELAQPGDLLKTSFIHSYIPLT